MKKINPNLSSFLHLAAAAAAAVAFVLILLLSTTTTATLMAAAEEEVGGCNATRIADCLADDEEFLMESETSRRILYAGNKITPGSQTADKGFCNRDVYGNCIGRPNKFYDKRPCGYAQTCRTDA